MSSLRELQTTCYQAFTGNDAAVLLPLVRDNGVAPEQRVEVYRNNFREIFRKTLVASFPVIERLVGEACLAGLAHQYTQAHPSRCGDIQRFGAAFPAFLDRTYGDTRFRYLSGVAALEWALEEVHVERDEPPLAISELGRFHEEDLGNLVFSDRRAVRLLRSPYPVLSIWHANQPGSSAQVDLDSGGENVAVTRRGNDLQMHLLDEAAFSLASELTRGARLEDAWQPSGPESGGENPGAAPDLAAALQTVLALGLFSGVSAAGTPPVNT